MLGGMSGAPEDAAEPFAEGDRTPVQPSLEFGGAEPTPVDPRLLSWPHNLPTDDDAMSFLLGRTRAVAPFAEATALLSKELKGPEIGALSEAGGGALEAWLRAAILMRWRLRAAMLSRPSAADEIDPSGVTELVGQATALVDAAPAGADWTKKHLVQALIDFGRGRTTLTPSRNSLEAKSARPSLSPRPSAPARYTSIEPSAPRPRRRQTILGVLFGISLVGAAAFHGYNYWLAQSRPKTGLLEGLPPGVVGTTDTPQGLQAVRVIDPAQHATVSEVLSKRAKSSGRVLIEPRPGFFVILPPGVSSPPAAAGNVR